MDQYVVTQALPRHGRRAERPSPSALHCSVRVLLSLVVGLGAVAGCSGEGRHDGSPVSSNQQPSLHPPIIRSAAVVPNPLVRTAPISVSVEKEEVQGHALTYRYQWFINKIPVQGETTTSLNYPSLRRGDIVSVEVVASNAQGESVTYRTPSVTVANAPPTITRVVLEQDLSQGNSRLVAKAEASDADQDDIHYVYRWLRNDLMMKEGPENVLETTALARKDIVTVEVTPHDLDGAGQPARATPLIVENNPPRIVSQPSVVTNSESYEYAVQAKDPDGDAVTFSLETAPPDMTIDQATGRLNLKISPALRGTHHVKIMVVDGQGGRGWQEFDLAVPTTAQLPHEPPSKS